ncbi:MAG: hypothetical protein BGO49_25245 [Planctomycetales bacterium 71-10]|nr:MAG: hypothetical protein BGO49_25245 [Planctomycetales bacterium 71-10]
MAELTSDPIRPLARKFVVERPEGRPPYLAIEATCGYCGGSHRVPFKRGGVKLSVGRDGKFRGPTAPCDPSKPWIPRFAIDAASLADFNEAKAELKAATSEWRRAKRGIPKSGPDVG